jgi:hypothetical protein
MKEPHFTSLKMHILDQQTCVNMIDIRCYQLPLLSSFLIKSRFLVYIEGNNYENDLKRPYFSVAVQPSVSTSISMNYSMLELNLYKLGLRPIIWFNFYLVILPKTVTRTGMLQQVYFQYSTFFLY